jgi:tRNA A-37 threonylcarbamoyl transferase component Bud32
VTEDHEFQVVSAKGLRAVLRHDLGDVSLEAMWADGAPLSDAKGRGGVSVLAVTEELRGVTRDFRRGGALGFLFPRSYLDPRRPERELRVLASLRRVGVPVVEPLAALSRRHLWIFHRLRLITGLIEGARPLPAFVAAEPCMRRAAVREAGRVTALAMEAGLEHRDFHPDNLVARQVGAGTESRVEVFILDLDRAELHDELSTAARDGMLLRMARYLRRHEGDLPIRPTVVDSLRFLGGLGLNRVGRRAELRRLAPLLARELERHGLR